MFTDHKGKMSSSLTPGLSQIDFGLSTISTPVDPETLHILKGREVHRVVAHSCVCIHTRT